MGKRNNRAKRSLSRLPKGLPVRGETGENPFEVTSRQKRPKHQVHNRNLPSQKKTRPSALAEAVALRKQALKEQLREAKKANVFKDGRIGEGRMTADEQNLARLVRERAQRSKRNQKYNLEGNEDETLLTHRGKAIGAGFDPEHVMLDDKEEGLGNLDEADTALHFGGGLSKANPSPYGPMGTDTLSNMYSSRKTELDDLILRRKIMKAEKQHSKELQVEAFEKLDDKFDQLADLLNFRDKEKEIMDHLKAKRSGTLAGEDKEFEEWDLQMKKYQFTERKVKATDRTKTPEEIAKEEAERLHELETRRLARMNGDFEEDDFSDIEDDLRRKRQKTENNPELLKDSDDEKEDTEKLRTRFTADGLVKLDKDGKVIGKVGEKKERPSIIYEVGTRVSANYHAAEQFDGNEVWYDGQVSNISEKEDGQITYDIEYDDGDFEEDVLPENVRLEGTAKEIKETKEAIKDPKEAEEAFRKRELAKEKARNEMPYVFEVPTTLDALHDLIAQYASTGEDASLIVHRIHASNSVRLDKRNAEKMQNFYDVLLKRFVAVGDAIMENGDGGPVLARFRQLDALTKTMYRMVQESPDQTAAVWGRRLGIFQNAHSKRLRDAEITGEDEEFSAWPFLGETLLLRTVGHIFPPTDLRHNVMTPTILYLSQLLAQTPIESYYDLTIAVMCAGILLEYTREAKRVNPEVLSFLSSALYLFAGKIVEESTISSPSIAAFLHENNQKLRSIASKYDESTDPNLSLMKQDSESPEQCAALLFSILSLSEAFVTEFSGSVESAEKELFAPLAEALFTLKPQSKSSKLAKCLQLKITSLAAALSKADLDRPREPLKRRAGPTLAEKAIKSLAPRMQDPDKYSMSKDKGKSSTQAAADRTRRELKREHKAISRELRLDGAFVEKERREEKNAKDSAAKAQRNKAFAWLESEQAAMNQQVRQGGGLIKGGGMGAARAKAATAKLGIKKGGKFKS